MNNVMIRVSALILISSIAWSSLIAWGAHTNANSSNALFQFHPPLMAFGFLVFMTSGLLSIINKKCKLLHSIFQIIASICVLTGVIVVMIAKTKNNEIHFQSAHAAIGLLAFIGVLYQCILGFLKYSGNTGRYRSHGLIGIATYTFGISALLIASSAYLCGNIVQSDKPGTYECADADLIGMQYSVTMLIPAVLVVVLYIRHVAQPRVYYPNVYSSFE